MKSVGHQISNVVGQQLCYAHAVQLAIKDTLYQQSIRPSESLEESDEEVDLEKGNELENEIECQQPSQMNLEHHDELMLILEDAEITDIVKSDVKAALDKVRSIVKVFRRGNAEIILDGIVQAKFNKVLKLQFDCATRWSSMYTMTSRFLKLYECIQLGLKRLKTDKIISKDEFNKLNEINIEPIKEFNAVLKLGDYITKKLSKGNCNLIQANEYKEFVIDQLLLLNTPMAIDFKYHLERRFDQRETIFTKILLYLNNAHSIKENEIPNISSEMVKLINRLFVTNDDTILADESNESCTLNLSTVQSTNSSVNSSESSALGERYHVFSLNRQSITKVQSKDAVQREVDNYTAFGTKGDFLIKLEKALMTIKSSTTDVERIFSQSKLVLTSLRNRLGDEILDDIIFIKYYFLTNL